MKIDYNQSNVEDMKGMGSAVVSQMKASPLAFDILSKRIYKNKIKAPIQELACNAKDAHVMVGTPERPIEVKLPNKLDAEFYVKDWGPGLSEEDVMTLYMTYFHSTKSESDDFTGAFGLGSKSPFSYCDQFFVTSCFNGVQTTYIAFKNNQGMPSISKVEGSTVPATDDWPHGLQVGFPARQEDFNRFAEEAAHVFRWFDVQPVVKGSYTPIKRHFVYEDEDFAVMAADKHDYYRHNKEKVASFARMGSVGYEIEPKAVQSHLSKAEFALIQCGLVLKMDIGELSVTASRESLEYDPKTLGALKRKIGAVAKKLISIGVEAVGADPKARSMARIVEMLKPFRATLDDSEWEKHFVAKVFHELDDKVAKFDLTLERTKELLTAHYMTLPGWTGSGKVGASVFEESNQGKLIQKRVQYGKVGAQANPARVSLKAGPIAIVVDNVSYAVNRCKKALEDGLYGELILVYAADMADRQKEAEKIAQYFCNAPVILATDLPEVAKPVRVKSVSAGLGRQATADRLNVFGDEEVMTFKEQHKSYDYVDYLSLTDALKKTDAYLVVNRVSDFVKNASGKKTAFYQGLTNMLRGIRTLHPAFKEAKLDQVVLLTSAQAQKLKAKETMRQWDVEVVRLLKEHQAEISAYLKTLPGFMAGALYYHRADEDFRQTARHPLTEHLYDWLGHNYSLEAPQGEANYVRFLRALDPDLRAIVEHLTAALGHAYVPLQETWGVSASQCCWEGLDSLGNFLDGEDATLAMALKADVAWNRDRAFHQMVGERAFYFSSLATRNGFITMLKETPAEAAKVYNAIWALGKQSAATPELKVVNG